MVLKDKRLLEYLKNGRSVSVYLTTNSEMGYVFLYKAYVMESSGKQPLERTHLDELHA